MRLLTTIYIATACCGMALAQETATVLTLDECKQLAVENNAKVKIARGNARAAEEVKKSAFTKYFPSVSAQGIGFMANHHVLEYDVLDLFTIGLVKKGWTAGVTATQPVFAGGRIVNGNKLAAVGHTAATLQEEAAANDVELTAEEYYWQIVTLKSKKSTLESVLQMVDTLERQVQVAVDAGVVNRNDLLKVQLRRNELRSLMVDLDNGISLAGNLLAQYVGKDGEKIDVVGDVPEGEVSYPSDVYMEPSAALASTTDYRLLEQKVKAADLEHRIAVGENLPTLGVGAGYYYDDLVNHKHNFGALFVSLSVPISEWWGGSHSIKKAKIELENAQIQQTDLSQMIELRMKNSWDELTSAYRKMDIARQSINQATENLRLNRNYYSAGISTITELLDAQMLFQQSVDSYTEAYGAFRVSRARYAQATGQSL